MSAVIKVICENVDALVRNSLTELITYYERLSSEEKERERPFANFWREGRQTICDTSDTS